MSQPTVIEKIRQQQVEKKPFVSFEFFPPKTEEGVPPLLERMKRLQRQGTLKARSPQQAKARGQLLKTSRS